MGLGFDEGMAWDGRLEVWKDIGVLGLCVVAILYLLVSVWSFVWRGFVLGLRCEVNWIWSLARILATLRSTLSQVRDHDDNRRLK